MTASSRQRLESGPEMRKQERESRRTGQATKVFELQITLLDIEPAIWRRFTVTDDATLAELHRIVQLVMGWMGGHLHEFETPDGRRYAATDPGLNPDGPGPDVGDAQSVTLREVLRRPGERIHYVYDFGDGWEHHIQLVEIRDAKPSESVPLCLGGERACPPEDCGGPWGYTELLEALANPGHERHEEFTEWLSDYQAVGFDPEAFALEELNAFLRSSTA